MTIDASPPQKIHFSLASRLKILLINFLPASNPFTPLKAFSLALIRTFFCSIKLLITFDPTPIISSIL